MDTATSSRSANPASEQLDDPSQNVPDRLPQRVRYPVRFRLLEVRGVQRVTPHLVRVTLQGDALEGFSSRGFDDHVKLFFPDPVTGELVVPTMGPDGLLWAEGAKRIMRDYTPRRFDAAAATLEIDFALHTAGPATLWAEQATPGQRLGVAGPKGSFIVSTDFDWHLLIGDDTALPAISRRLAELPPNARANVLLEVDGAADHITFESAANIEVVWVHRSADAGVFPLLDALHSMPSPTGTFHTWVGCESAQAKALRAYLVAERHANPKWIRASGYWRKGSIATHDSYDG